MAVFFIKKDHVIITWSENFSAFLDLLFSPLENCLVGRDLLERDFAAGSHYISNDTYDTRLAIWLRSTTKQS